MPNEAANVELWMFEEGAVARSQVFHVIKYDESIL